MKNSAGGIFTVVSTRFGVGVTDIEWLKHRLALFKAITAPCLRNQERQDFTWCIFVGVGAFDWVIEELKLITRGVGSSVEIVKSAQDLDHLRMLAADSKKQHVIVAMIDDDDAWMTGLTREINIAAEGFIGEGKSKCLYTYTTGIEWLVTDIADIDALQKKNAKIIRRQAAYPYRRPFLTMSSFTLAPVGEIPDGIFGAHSSYGQSVAEAGFELVEIENVSPAWLYVRHKQADSSIRKAHDVAALNHSLAGFAEIFGIDEQLVRAYQSEAEGYGYSVKRIRKGGDRSNMVFRLDESEGFSVEKPTARSIPVGPHGITLNVFEFFNVEDSVRVVIYDNNSKVFSVKEVVEAGGFFSIGRESLSFPLDSKLKVQKKSLTGIWVDCVGYQPLVELAEVKN